LLGLVAAGALGLGGQRRARAQQDLPAAPPASALASLAHDIGALVTTAPADRGTWGIVIKTTAGETVYALNERKLFVPASNMKVLTLAAAAERLGWDFTFDTRLVAAGPIGARGLDGDLVVVGSGDPTIDNWDGAATTLFRDWADRLRRLGVSKIHGRIIGDDDSFDDEAWGSGWAWDDLDRSFATGVGALQFNQNTAQLKIRGAARSGAPASVEIEPAGSGLTIRNFATSGGRGDPPIEVRRRLDGPTLELRGSVAAGNGTVVRNVAVANPTLYFATALRDGLIAAGIEVEGEAVDIDDITDPPSRARGNVLLDHHSPPLSEMAKTMMELSQNLYAETLLKTIGSQQTVGSSAAGRTAVAGVLEAWGLSPDEFKIVDGSGLSVYDLVTPDLVAGVLTHVALDEQLRRPFEASLPVAGREGTLSRRMRGTAAEGNVRAKTGSLSNSRALSGYVRDADGEDLVFSILVNNFGASSDAVDRAMDGMLVRLAQFRRR
jgi:D-alanyl-D-alanine carboxypeptidase/D-alanyl-D-alanine-endopeptidase (penicillin-binding protein 4)